MFTSAFPDEANMNKTILVIDRFLSGLKDEKQRRFVLQQKNQDDNMDNLIELALKYEAVNQIMDIKSSSFSTSPGFNNVNSIEQRPRRNDFFNNNYKRQHSPLQ